MEDGQVWVERVPRHIRTVADAEAFITPAAVHRARAEQRRVLRQGDVWLVELRAGRDNTALLPHSHRFDPATRTLSHRQHGTLHVPYPFRVELTKSVLGSAAD